MYHRIHKLSLINFRNLSPSILEFSPGINYISGRNGHGKTNILEAIYYLCYRKSFRKNTSFPQIVNINAENLEIYFSAVIEDTESRLTPYSGKINSVQSSWTLNNKNIKNRPHLPCVFINPFDSYEFHHTQKWRRDFFDHLMEDLYPNYSIERKRYQKALKQKNILLQKRTYQFKQQVQQLNKIIAEQHIVLIRYRINFLKQINPLITQSFKQLFSREHYLLLEYETMCPSENTEVLAKFLNENLELEVEAGRSKYGAHLDNYHLLFDQLNALEFCSLGQQKMGFLSLIFAYIELFRYNRSTYPLVLIDDVSGELDRTRWDNLMQMLEDNCFQVFITSANEDFGRELMTRGGVRSLSVVEGAVDQTQSNDISHFKYNNREHLY